MVVNMLSHQDTIGKLDEFATFKQGWQWGESIPFSKSTLSKALELVKEAAKVGFIHTDAFPGTAGEIMITIYDHPHYLEFIVRKDGLVDFVREYGSDELEDIENVPFEDAKAKIAMFWLEWHGQILEKQG